MLRRGQSIVLKSCLPQGTHDIHWVRMDNDVGLPSSFWTWLGIPMMVVLLLLFLVFSNLFTGFKGLNVEPEKDMSNSLCHRTTICHLGKRFLSNTHALTSVFSYSTEKGSLDCACMCIFFDLISPQICRAAKQLKAETCTAYKQTAVTCQKSRVLRNKAQMLSQTRVLLLAHASLFMKTEQMLHIQASV